jgi:pimeloyl-ACP methyl ester carboxylesterase
VTVASSPADEWESRGEYVDLDGRRVFVVDVPAAAPATGPPLFVLHGFPTCSADWRHVLEPLAAERRVVLFDFVGFGLSDKPDMRYSIRGHADVAERVADERGLREVTLLTHDMGDSVGGELLARDLDGVLGFTITQRVLTNGSIYLDLAQLTAGQQMLLALDDAGFDLATLGLDPGDGFRSGVGGTFSAHRPASAEELALQWELARRHDGHTLLARTIRYIEDRRAEEHRYTGAIEEHPSPVGVVWGRHDPVAVHAMAERFVARRTDARLVTLEDAGHYPMVEDPVAFSTAVLDLVAGHDPTV